MKSVLITGATNGLGASLTAQFAQAGLDVVAIGRKPHESANMPDGVRYIRADFAKVDNVTDLVEEIGHCPDCIVPAAVAYPNQDILFTDVAELESYYRVNALIPTALCGALLERRAPEQFAAAIFIGSESTFAAHRGSALYASTKAALRVLYQGLADANRSKNAAISMLMLGPLANEKKLSELSTLAKEKGVSDSDITKLFLRKSNRNLVIDELIDFESCRTCIEHVFALGPIANGMMCRLDGGSSGSLI
ncbi:SDR family oxidoreductase [uncultured Tateyamaria sp.]|uniref:SDR family NAD(P)-dependent oxidoreductase n=1 Tax=Tateyamaria sp. 1078 TaxID=3417464 RepID=UPI0026115F6B|nr:SDR family oxidoreductase [uncultured Tateyamaria sp.]